jgi:predicted dehydrogenase
VTRRRFIQTTAAASALLVRPAAGWMRAIGANDRLHLAVIGTGGMGHAHLRGLMSRRERDNVAVTKVCDVYRRRLTSAVRRIEGDASSGTMEYREVLDDRGVDAVLIATPDHWHTKIAIEAMEAGKDVYCEKPLSLTIEQAIACRDAVRRTGRVLQVGPQGTSDDRYWKAQSAIAAGRIGKVTWSQGSYCRNSRDGQFNWHIDPDAGPHNPPEADGYVWWDRWLGHEWGLAERISWNPDHFFRFRKYFAYNGGVATDLLYHKLAPLLLSISGPDGEYPDRVVASGGRYIEKDERDIPDTFMLTVDYPSEHTAVMISVMTNDVGIPTVIHGQHGTMEFNDRLITITEQGTWWREFRQANAGLFSHRLERNEQGGEEPDPKPGQASFDLHTSPRRDHMGNFLDAVRGEAAPHCNVDLGCSTMVAIKMGVEAYRRSKTMRWDADRERMIES